MYLLENFPRRCGVEEGMLERLPQDGGVNEGVVVHLHHELGRAALPWNQIIK